jgi:hypothetical protein
MTDLDKLACTYLLARGLCTPAEAARLAGRSRQIARHWARAGPADSRERYLRRQFARVKSRLSNDAYARKEES